MKKEFKKGQSILEYTLVLGAVIAVIVAVLLGTGGIKDKIQTAYTTSGTALKNTTDSLNGKVFGTPEVVTTP
jgi:Flp pilus assembly pilin Flp